MSVVKICSAHESCVQYGKFRTFKTSKVKLEASSVMDQKWTYVANFVSYGLFHLYY